MWEAINQHVALATATNSPILHVLIAEKVVTSLTDVFNNIITYVQTLDTSDDPELQGIELEYISALANDTALHIEEVIELIDTFTISEIRERIDEIFDPLTTLLVQCGQVRVFYLLLLSLLLHFRGVSLVCGYRTTTIVSILIKSYCEPNYRHVSSAWRRR